MRLQRFGEHRTMPWKNGQGVTREVAAFPPDADASAFLWRVSLATVKGSGPFSLFPGIDRTIAVVTGEGMQLTVDGVKQSPLTRSASPFSFSGDADVHAESLGGETLDLNVMTRRLGWTHSMDRLTILAPITLVVDSDAALIAFGDQVSVSSADGAFDAGTGDVLLGLGHGDSVTLVSQDASASVFVIKLSAPAQS